MVAFWLSGQRRWSIKGSRDTSCCVGEHQRQGQVRISSFRRYLGVTNHCLFHCDLTGLRFVPRCRWGRTPLQDAVDGSHFAMVAMLRSKGGAMPESLSAMQVSERGNIWSSLHSFSVSYSSTANEFKYLLFSFSFLCSSAMQRPEAMSSLSGYSSTALV